MKATEFAYWLQGHFEIKGTQELTQTQAQKVLEKADTVTATQDNSTEAKAYAFVSYAQGLLTAAVEAGTTQKAGPLLQQKLNALFIHDIDPSYPGDQTQFNNLHQPKPPKGPIYPPGVRC